MKTLSNERSPRTIVRLLTSTFLACLVAAVCVVALPGLAVGPAGDAQKAYDDWVAANEAVKEAKENVKDAKDKLANIMAVSATGGITEGEERALAKARDEVAKAEAALKDAEAKLDAARIELEKAIAELEDEKLKKELIRKRDGYISAQRFTAIAPAKASLETKSGLRTVTFDTLHGTVKVNLPDDIRAGDTISGTVVVEPKGQTEEERKKASDAVRTLSVEISPQETQPDGRYTTTAAAHTVRMAHYSATDILFTMTLPPIDPNRRLDVLGVTLKGEDSTTGIVTIPLEKGWTVIPLERSAPTPPKTPSNPPSSSPPGAGNFQLPTLGQQGRPVQIFGPFDGNASNTTLRFVPSTSAVKDFEKTTENVSGGVVGGRALAESPRSVVIETPTNFTGPAEIVLKEGSVEARGVAHVLGVALSAPKTNLMRGERTTLYIEVRGLEGIKEDVPLQLDSKGVITMDGGNFQNLWIKPPEVTPDGRYTTNRAITGVQAGGFNVTATVVVNRFDFCLQDDADPNRLFYLNSFTGAYMFRSIGLQRPLPPKPPGGTVQPGGTTQPGGTVQPGGTTQPGGTGPQPIQPSGTTLTGIGRPAMKGCIITLSHNAPDRRVFARLDACTKTGDASVQTNSPKADIKITDKNTADNTAASPPK